MRQRSAPESIQADTPSMEPVVFGTLLIGSVGVAFLAAYGLLSLILGLMMGTTSESVGQPDVNSLSNS
jgi:F0F1-type ATP synthase membrane subunit c/vacuolar-type H+-ATPase subunit K